MKDDTSQQHDPSHQQPLSDAFSPDPFVDESSEYGEYTGDRKISFTPSRDSIKKPGTPASTPEPELPELPAMMQFLAQERQRKKKRRLYLTLTSVAVLLVLFAGGYAVLAWMQEGKHTIV